MTSRARAVAGVAFLVAAVAAGCSPVPGGDAAADVVTRFYAAVAAGEGRTACALLAPAAVESLEDDTGETCADALTSGDVATELADRAPAGATHSVTAGGQAQVRTEHDVVFLAASGDTWAITAAGCDPREDRPYDCTVESG